MYLLRHEIFYKGKYTGYDIYENGLVYRHKKDDYYEIKPILDHAGYKKVSINITGKFKNYYVHRLVAKYYLKSWNKDLTVNHIDGDKLNNHYYNLEMLSLSDNVKHYYKNLNTKHLSKYFTNEQAKEIRLLHKQGDLTIKQIAEKYNVIPKVITNIVNGITYKNIGC